MNSLPGVESAGIKSAGFDSAGVESADAVVTWLNGDVITGEARLSASDHGVSVGDGVFETFVLRHAAVIGLDAHLDRLARSLRRIGIAPVSEAEVRGGLGELVKKIAERGPGRDEAHRVRLTVTAGPGPAGLRRGDRPTVMISATPMPAQMARPLHLVVSPWRRNERGSLTGIKSTSKGDDAVAVHDAQARGADDAIWLNTSGDLCETTVANLYVIDGDTIATPHLASGCLPGIARQLMLEEAAGQGLPILEQRISGQVLDRVRAGEAGLMVSSAVRGFVPVALFEGVVVPAQAQADAMARAWQKIGERRAQAVVATGRD